MTFFTSRIRSVSVGLFVLCSLFGASTNAVAGLSPLAFAIVPPVQFPPDGYDVTGARVSLIYGQHREVYGFDIGVPGNRTDVGFTGIAVSGGFNYNKGTTTAIGLQLAGITNVNVNKASVYGAQIALGLNSNQAESTIVGLAIAAVNYGPAMSMNGFEVGLYNRAQTVRGFQIGIVNDCDVLHGIQIGLLNIHRRGLFSMAPILNIGF